MATSEKTFQLSVEKDDGAEQTFPPDHSDSYFAPPDPTIKANVADECGCKGRDGPSRAQEFERWEVGKE